MEEDGENLDDNQFDIGNTIMFRLDPNLKPEMKETKEQDDVPMWSSALPGQMDCYDGYE